MKTALIQGLKSYRYLADMHEYTRLEIVLKVLLLPILYVLNTVMFVAVLALYMVERFFAHFFRHFIRIQAFFYKKRTLAPQGIRRLYTLGGVIVFFVFAPFILVYYLSMMFKAMGKHLMRALVKVVDFSDRYSKEESPIMLFDDVPKNEFQLSGALKDIGSTQAIGNTFESMLKEMHSETIEDIEDAEEDS